tara:strand:+ start:384 stop:1346 length:963 start_codon:yes stop_codon:yes gene_type:complete
MGYKFATLSFLLLLLNYTISAQETGTLYLKKVNGKIGWFDSGNAQKNWKYTGDIFEGEPNGNGELTSPFEKYSGEFIKGKMHGQITHSYDNGKKRVGEFRNGKPWNVKSFDRKGSLENMWVDGIKLKKLDIPPQEWIDAWSDDSYMQVWMKEREAHYPSKYKIHVFSGNTTGAAKTSNSTFSLYWENYGLGYNYMSYTSTSSDDNDYNMQNSSIELSYTTDFSFRGINNYSATLGFGRVFSGSGEITSETPSIEFESSSVSGFAIFEILGIKWNDLEFLLGLRHFRFTVYDFTSEVPNVPLEEPFTINGSHFIFGLGYNF